VVFTLVGVPLSIPPSRAVRSRGFSMSLALIFLYYIPLTVGQTLADKGIVPAVVGLWLPNAVFLAIGVFLFRNAARELPIRALEYLELWAMRARALVTERFRMLGAS
jgi:lipopolysaccharide export LptBFGC system permease protein LptF